MSTTATVAAMSRPPSKRRRERDIKVDPGGPSTSPSGRGRRCRKQVVQLAVSQHGLHGSVGSEVTNLFRDGPKKDVLTEANLSALYGMPVRVDVADGTYHVR